MIIDWNPNVNSKFSLEGNHGLSEGYINTLQFDSGKKRIYSKNSFVPRKYPSIHLWLNNRNNDNLITEFEEFRKWFNVNLRYGILPFYAPRIGFKPDFRTKVGEIGIYEFLPNSLSYKYIDGFVCASFGLEEINYIPEIQYVFLATDKGEILLTNRGEFIIVGEEKVWT
jgi:hypothetical protein